MAAILEPDVLVTSYDVTSLCCGPQREQFWAYYLPSKFRCHNFNILGVKRAPSRSQKTKKKLGLNRVNTGFFRSTTWSVLMEVEPLLVICYTISLLSFKILKQYCSSYRVGGSRPVFSKLVLNSANSITTIIIWSPTYGEEPSRLGKSLTKSTSEAPSGLLWVDMQSLRDCMS